MQAIIYSSLLVAFGAAWPTDYYMKRGGYRLMPQRADSYDDNWISSLERAAEKEAEIETMREIEREAIESAQDARMQAELEDNLEVDPQYKMLSKYYDSYKIPERDYVGLSDSYPFDEPETHDDIWYDDVYPGNIYDDGESYYFDDDDDDDDYDYGGDDIYQYLDLITALSKLNRQEDQRQNNYLLPSTAVQHEREKEKTRQKLLASFRNSGLYFPRAGGASSMMLQSASAVTFPFPDEETTKLPLVTMSVDKAKDLLGKLKTAESMREGEQKDEKRAEAHEVDTDRLDTLLGEKMTSPSVVEEGKPEELKVKDDLDMQMSAESDDEVELGETMEMKMELLKQENQLLIEAVAMTVKGNVNADVLRDLIERAKLRQDAIDYIEEPRRK